MLLIKCSFLGENRYFSTVVIFLTVDRNAELNNRTSFNFTVCDSFIKLLNIHYVPSMQKSG